MNSNSNRRTDDREPSDEFVEQSMRSARTQTESSGEQGLELPESSVGDSLDPPDEVEKLKAALQESEKRALLAAADLDNFRKRTRQNTQDQLRYATLGMMNDILEAVDNLQRAIESAENDPSGPGLLEGVKMVSDQISSILESHGCKRIESLGQPFDPNLHQAVKMEPSQEFPANTVMRELRSGFQLHDRVIRPVQVFVSTGPAK